MLTREYFKNKELSCRCGCGAMPAQDAIERLYALRIVYGKPISIRSGARCPNHNQAIGGSDNSLHITFPGVCEGMAFDVAVPPENEVQFVGLAVLVGFTGIGIKNNDFIHIDQGRETDALWTY